MVPRRLPLFVALFAAAFAQQPPHPREEDRSPRLKQSQIEDILRDDHKKSIADTAAILKLAEELKIELEKNDRHVLSLAAIKKTEEIEKIAKRIRGRMRRY